MEEGSESVRRITRGPTRGVVGVIAVVVGLVVALVAVDLASEPDRTPSSGASTTTTPPAPTGELQGRPAELTGVPLAAPTGLELVVGGTLVEVDRDRRTWVAGLVDRPAGQAAGMELFQVGADTVIVRSFSCEGCGPAEVRVLVLPAGATRSEEVLADDAISVAPAPDGLWITRRGVDRCVLSKVGLGGATLVTARPVDCGTAIRAETALGLLADSRVDPEGAPIPTSFLLDPSDLSERFHARQILAVAGDRLLAGTGGDAYEVRPIDGPGHAFGTPGPTGPTTPGAVSHDGRYAVVQVPVGGIDLWVADLVEARWLRVPSFPLGLGVGPLPHGWTADGRLVLFGPFVDGLGDRDLALATWRPGDARVAVRPVDYPPGALAVRPVPPP